MRKFIWTLVAAALGSAAIAPFGPAAARKVPVSFYCGAGLGQCNYNCQSINDSLHDPDGSKFTACTRKCMAVYNMCERMEGTGPRPTVEERPSVRALDKPLGGNSGFSGGSILDTGSIIGSQAPAATGLPAGGGRPAATPSAPVIIR
jgi:hypothetical protein